MITLPVLDAPAQVQEITLDSVPYKISISWSDRQGCWTMAWASHDDVEIVSGIRVSIGPDLLNQYRHLKMPQGELYAVDTNGTIQEIGRADLPAGNILLVYVSPGETIG